MGLSDIIERIKSALGMGSSGRRRQRQRGQQPRQRGQGQGPEQGQQPQQQHEGGQQPRAARQTGRQQGAPRHGGGQGHRGGQGSSQPTGRAPQRRQGETDAVDVTVEREPDTRSEDAVKGTDTSGEPVTESIAAEEIQNGTGGSDAGSEGSSAPEDGAGTPGSGESVDEIKGIGPTYAERLGEAGIETVADLADSDLDDVAGRANVPRGRLETWIERARHRD